jgi:serine/threonine protein kinase
MGTDSNSRCDTKVLPPRLATGQRLKHFQLESVVGEGGMGVVYRANDTQLCRPVAVKVLPAELTSDPERKQRFLQEARAAARINHPAVAQIHYVDEQDGVTFLVMELVEGKTVRDLIRAGELDLLGVVEVVAQAAEGLAKAHELGIVHRDIKPANVMVTADGHVKILDFGLAKLLDRPPFSSGAVPPLPPSASFTTLPGMVLGTAAYMSPEQVRGSSLDARADIFALGILLFEMATGRSPFHRESFVDSLHAVAFEEPPPLASLRGHLPDELQRIVSRCLKKRPEDRYSDARLLARDLRELRRSTEAGLLPKTDWQLRLTDTWDRIRHLPPSQYVWFALAAIVAGLAVYFSLSRIGTGGALLLGIGGLLVYRHLRNRPQRVQEALVRRLAKIPEVRLVTLQARQFTVVVDHPVAQLYARINQQVQTANRKLYFGVPMTVSIQHSLAPEQTRQLLSGSGVQFVREDVLREK